MKLSAKQERVLNEIKRVTGIMGKDRWFIREEIVGAGLNTMTALVEKGLLVKKHEDTTLMPYYQLIPKVTVKKYKMVPAKE